MLSVNHFDEQKWPALVFFSICGLFFLGCLWYLWTGARNPDDYWQPSEALALESPEPFLAKDKPVVLAKNHGAQTDTARIVYRGRQNGSLHMDLFILQLDPHYGYPHTIDECRARKGFQLGDDYFAVSAASDSKISLKRL